MAARGRTVRTRTGTCALAILEFFEQMSEVTRRPSSHTVRRAFFVGISRRHRLQIPSASITAITRIRRCRSCHHKRARSQITHSPKMVRSQRFDSLMWLEEVTDFLPELSRLLDSSELPDPLVDFILKYSRRYTDEGTTDEVLSSPKHRPSSADSGLESPMSARSAPHASPEVPTGGNRYGTSTYRLEVNSCRAT